MAHVNGGDELDDENVATCPTCGGEGGFHDCGDDSCCCADPGGPTDFDWWDCSDCGGTGVGRG